MPTITIALDQTDTKKKKQLIKSLSSKAADITEYSIDSFFIYIREYSRENIGAQGKT